MVVSPLCCGTAFLSPIIDVYAVIVLTMDVFIRLVWRTQPGSRGVIRAADSRMGSAYFVEVLSLFKQSKLEHPAEVSLA